MSVGTGKEAATKFRPEMPVPGPGVTVEEELWLGSGSIFKVKSRMCADKLGLG